MADHNAKSSDLVQLNIGGERLVTVPRSTLAEGGDGDSMLKAMFSGRHKLKTDEQVRIEAKLSVYIMALSAHVRW